MDGSSIHEEWHSVEQPPLPGERVRVKFRGVSGWTYEPPALYQLEPDGTWWLLVRSSRGESMRRAIGAPTHWRLP